MFGLFKGKKKTTDLSKLSREELIAEATANANKARAELGEENIQKLAAALRGEEEIQTQISEGRKAQEKIRAMDKERVAEELKYILKEDK